MEKCFLCESLAVYDSLFIDGELQSLCKSCYFEQIEQQEAERDESYNNRVDDEKEEE